MHLPVPAHRPSPRAPLEPVQASSFTPGQHQGSLHRYPSFSQGVTGASPLALSVSGRAPPMSPACFASGDLASTSLSGAEPKAQKPIRSACKTLADSSFRTLQKQEIDPGWRTTQTTPRSRCADTRNVINGVPKKSVKGSGNEDISLTSDDDFNLAATTPSSRTVSNNRTGVKMSTRNVYRTVDPWASYDDRQGADGTKPSGVFPGIHSASHLSQEPQKTWGAKGQPSGPGQPARRAVGETDADVVEYPYMAKKSNDSCSTAASFNNTDIKKGGSTGWGKLELSDGVRYASAYIGRGFSRGSTLPGNEAPPRDSQALYASATSIGDVFVRPGASGNISTTNIMPAPHHAVYVLADPATQNRASSSVTRVPFTHTYQTSTILRGNEERSSISPGAPVSVAYGQPVVASTPSRRLPMLPVAPLDSGFTADYFDYLPAVHLSPVRNVTSGISTAAAAASESWNALSSLLASTPAPPICPPVSDDSVDVSSPKVAADPLPSPSGAEKRHVSPAPPARIAEKKEDHLETKRKMMRRVSEGFGDSRRVRDLSPVSPTSRASRLHLFCGVMARPMKPSGGAGGFASPTKSRGGTFQSALSTSLQATTQLQNGERSGTVGLTSLLLEKTTKPSNKTRLLPRPLQLIHVNRWDGREVLTIDEEARKFLNELGTQHVAVISVCGVTQTGKSSLANLLLDDSHMHSSAGFPVGTPAIIADECGTFDSISPSASFGKNGNGIQKDDGLGLDDAETFRGEAGKKFTQRILSDGCTEGAWVQAVAIRGEGASDGKNDFVYLILDFEGVGCTRKTVEHDQRLFTLAMLVSHYLVYTTRGVLDAEAVSGLASVSLWTQRLLQGGDRGTVRDSPVSLENTSDTSPTREGPSTSDGPSVPSGWRAPPLLWILQDFNFSLSDEDDYPLTETDYLEAIMATASHPATCCSPFSSEFPFSAALPFSRTCAELNLPHIRMLRQQLETLFGDRTCLALPHPLGDYPDLSGDNVGCGAFSRPFRSSNDIDPETGFGAFLVSPGQPSSFASSFPALTKSGHFDGRDGEGIGESRGPGAPRRASSQFIFREASPPNGPYLSSRSPVSSHRVKKKENMCLPTISVREFQPIYRRRLQQAKNMIFKECQLKASQSVAVTGPGFVKILQRMIDGINGGQVPESGSVVVVVQREECRKWKEKCEQLFMTELRDAFQTRLPVASRDLQEGALALQKKALALFKMHVIGDDDVVRGYKQQLKDRLRKITDRAMEENERHGEWKARSRLRLLRERLHIDEKLNERLYESMSQVNEDVERLKEEFNADIRGPSHVYHRVLNDQVDQILAKGSEIVCGALLDQSRLAEKTVHELQQRAQEAEISLEKTLELEQQLQNRDYETEELRRALQEERAANRGQATLRTGDFDYDDDFVDPYGRRGSSFRRPVRSRFATGEHSKYLRQKKCTIM